MFASVAPRRSFLLVSSSLSSPASSSSSLSVTRTSSTAYGQQVLAATRRRKSYSSSSSNHYNYNYSLKKLNKSSPFFFLSHHHPRHHPRLRCLSSNNNNSTIEIVPEPTRAELRAIATATAIPFIGFGFMDNAILIIAGDAIDTSLGVWIGISTMCAAAIGNIISDIVGIVFGAAIEDFCAKYMALPSPNLTAAQRQLRSVRFANQWGTGVGMVFGCILGMCPLFFIDSNKVQAMKREAHMDSIFRDVVTEAASLIGAQRACLFLIVNKDDDDDNNTKKKKKKQEHPVPTPDGKFLYAKYDAAVAARRTTTPKNAATSSSSTSGGTTTTTTTTTTTSSTTTTTPTISDRYIPLGRGIVSRAALTGETWNIDSVDTEPEFASEQGGHDSNDSFRKHGDDPSLKITNMVCVPVLNAQGRAIAVIQAINKIGKGSIAGGDEGKALSSSSSSSLPLASLLSPHQQERGFTHNDVQVLKALASHISVKLQLMYEDLGGKDSEEHQLKDTIRMLKEYGLQGVEMLEHKDQRQRVVGRHRRLFPED